MPQPACREGRCHALRFVQDLATEVLGCGYSQGDEHLVGPATRSPRGYSERSASAGSTLEAARAGKNDAKIVTATTNPAAVAREVASRNEVW